MSGPSRAVRGFVVGLLVLLVVPGVIGFDAWPLTGWRLFSADRGNRQDRWEIEVVTQDGDALPVDLDRLTIAYRNAEWILAELPGASDAHRDAVCLALLGGVREHADPAAAGLRVVRNRRRMEESGGDFVVIEDREPVHACGRSS